MDAREHGRHKVAAKRLVAVTRSGKGGIATQIEPYVEIAGVLQLQPWAFETALIDLREGLAIWHAATDSAAEEVPAEGDVRYYRKRRGRGGPGRDLMLRVPEPRNITWQPAGEAPKARKGIEHLEGLAPPKLERSAKGGSVWRATF